MYKVITDFADKLDNGYVYHIGDTYPRSGVEAPSTERVRELSGSWNAQHKPLIVSVVDDVDNDVAGAEVEKTVAKKPQKKTAVAHNK